MDSITNTLFTTIRKWIFQLLCELSWCWWQQSCKIKVFVIIIFSVLVLDCIYFLTFTWRRVHKCVLEYIERRAESLHAVLFCFNQWTMINHSQIFYLRKSYSINYLVWMCLHNIWVWLNTHVILVISIREEDFCKFSNRLPTLHSAFQTTLDYRVKPCPPHKKKRTKILKSKTHSQRQLLSFFSRVPFTWIYIYDQSTNTYILQCFLNTFFIP